MVLFSGYYQFLTSSFGVFDLINLVSNLVLLLGAYSYIFKKKLISAKNWGFVFKVLMGMVFVNLIYQIWPSSYVGNFSPLNGALVTNIFAYLFVTCFYLPLYYAVYLLSKPPKTSKSHKK